MKITAHFESSDSADFAAGALKRSLSPLSEISTTDLNKHSGKTNMNIFAAFNPSVTTPTYSMPVYTHYAFDNNSSTKNTRHEHILEVVCRKEDYQTVSKIIINHGGRNISKI